MNVDKTDMSFWFPKLEAAGLPVPKTIQILMSQGAFRDVFRALDGEEMNGDAQPFFDQIKKAADHLGYPCFLRTGQTSAKHDWGRTCFLKNPNQVSQHVINIVEFSEIAQMPIGLSCEWWFVREFLPTTPITSCPNFRNMPVCMEFRVFVDDGEVRCWHPYWPLKALVQGGAPDAGKAFDNLSRCADIKSILSLASEAGSVVGGSWSVDVLETKRGWYITDMAEAHKSFHWEDCDKQPPNRSRSG